MQYKQSFQINIKNDHKVNYRKQRRIQKPVKPLKWGFLGKKLTAERTTDSNQKANGEI